MREFAERYYREVVVRDRKDPRNMRRYIDKEILPALGGKVIRDVPANDIQTLVFRKGCLQSGSYHVSDPNNRTWYCRIAVWVRCDMAPGRRRQERRRWPNT